MNVKRLTFSFKNISPVKFFILVASFFGLLFMLTTPPFQAPDEPVHFFRAYQISEGNLRVDGVGNVQGGILPSSLEQIVTGTAYSPQVQFVPGEKYNWDNTREALSVRTNPEQKQVYDFSTTAYYSPVSYIPQATGTFIGRIIDASPLISFYLGRLLNLATWIVLFAAAIHLIPRRKWAVVFIGLIPMALFQAASLSSDVMAVGVLAVVFAMILKLKQQTTPIQRKQGILLLVLLSVLVLSKQVMFLFLLLALLLPGHLFRSRKVAYGFKALCIGIPLALFGLWMLAVGNVPLSTSVNGVDPVVQTHNIIHNPYNFINAAWNTYFFSWGDGITRSFIGNFGWVDTPLSEAIVVIGYVTMFLIFVASTEKTLKPLLSKRQRLFVVAIGLAYVAAVTGALYAYFTPVDFKIIIGLVGRYYLPFAILLIPVVAGSWLSMNAKSYKKLAVLAPLFLLTVSYVTLYYRYYINNV